VPASIAHMLIAHKTLKKLQENESKRLAEFAKMLDRPLRKENYRAYMNLGSLGPDLYYFEKLVRGFMGMVADGYVSAKAVTPWAYHLHSSRPNEFALKLIEITFSDVVRKGKKVVLDVDDCRKLAYIAGHLSHIAADQIIHPVVNAIAGPYYRDGKNREEHRKAEVFQDYFLYEEVYRAEDKSKPTYQFFEQDFRSWVDCIRGATLKNTEEWFRYFLQRGFIETYGSAPDEDTIEDSVDGVLASLWAAKKAGPYKEAAKEYAQGRDGPKFIKYIRKPKYLSYYEQAVELSVVYMTALFKIYELLRTGQDFTNTKKRKFCKIVSDADLSCPLQKDILEKARAAL